MRRVIGCGLGGLLVAMGGMTAAALWSSHGLLGLIAGGLVAALGVHTLQDARGRA